MPYAEYHAGAGTPSNPGFKGNGAMNVEAIHDIDQLTLLSFVFFTSGRTIMLDNLSEGKRGRIRVSVIPTC